MTGIKEEASDTTRDWWDDLQKQKALLAERARREAAWEEALRWQIVALPRLPRRAPPQPWEDLASVLARSAQAMGYAHPSWILRPERLGYGVKKEELPLLRRKLDYELLGHLLDLDEATIHSLTLHRFTTVLEGYEPAYATHARLAPPLHRLPSWVARRLFGYNAATIQVCPVCLDEPDPYDRIYWRATPAMLCLRHGTWLIKQCPACHKAIPALRPRLEACPFCGGDFRRSVLPVLPQARWLYGMHRVFFAHLGIDTGELDLPPPQDERSPLQDLTSADYLWLVSQFLELLSGRPPRERLLPFLLRVLPLGGQAPAPAEEPLLLLHHLLADWPMHFWSMLERLQLALEEDYEWTHSAYGPAREWERHLAQADVWYQGRESVRAMEFFRAFFDAVEAYFREHRHALQRSAPSGGRVIPAASGPAPHPPSSVPAERLAPQPWEDLSSLISRVAREMHLAQADELLISPDPPRRKVFSRVLPLLRRRADYRVLEARLGLGERQLYRLTLHQFATRLEDPGRRMAAPSAAAHAPAEGIIGGPLLSLSMARWVTADLRHTKICPACLEEELAYDRLSWRLRQVVLCTRHSLALIDRCPRCRAPVPAFRLVAERCPYCRDGDYRLAARAVIPPASLLHQGQTLLLSMLTEEREGKPSGPPAFVGSPILKVEPWQYFALWERFEALFWYRSVSHTAFLQALEELALHDVPLESASRLLQEMGAQTVLFHFLLAHWPDNLLAAYRMIAARLKEHGGFWVMSERFFDDTSHLQNSNASLAVGEAAFTLLLPTRCATRSLQSES